MKAKMTLGTLALSACTALNVVAARISLEWNATAGAELAAVLLTPYVDEEFHCNLQKVLGGLNCQPWRVGR